MGDGNGGTVGDGHALVGIRARAGEASLRPAGAREDPAEGRGTVVKIDQAQSKVTVREASGGLHEFQASKETLQDLKVGDRIDANLREAPKCP